VNPQHVSTQHKPAPHSLSCPPGQSPNSPQDTVKCKQVHDLELAWTQQLQS
jgi:hypothetical protein